MNHWLIAPVLLPLLCGILLTALAKGSPTLQRLVSGAATAALLPIAIGLLIASADGSYRVYALGDWPPPFGIVLVLDRLSGTMLVLTAVLAACSLLYAMHGSDAEGKNFHALFQLQLMGLNGAFLTGDLFNLFVFFEVLLLASYGLLLHGGSAARTRAGFHYVVLNLFGSSLFLIAVGVLYGTLGTLNMADLAVKMLDAPAEDVALLRASGLLLLVVFALKAAVLPWYFWLPSAYAAASAPVAALFAIMTKVGVYAIIRVFTLVFGPHAGGAADLGEPWVLTLALATLIAAALGVLAASSLRSLIAYLIILSTGMLLSAVGLFSTDGLSAALVYLVHTTLITAGLFLLADAIGMQRTQARDRLETAQPVVQPLLLGTLFLIGAVAIVGVPPLSGFTGKLMILLASRDDPAVTWIWTIVLGASLMSLVALSRAGSIVFWNTKGVADAAGTKPAGLLFQLPLVGLLSFSVLLVVCGRPLTVFTDATAGQLADPQAYIEGVLGQERAVKAPAAAQADG